MVFLTMPVGGGGGHGILKLNWKRTRVFANVHDESCQPLPKHS